MNSKEMETTNEAMRLLTKDLQDRGWSVTSFLMFRSPTWDTKTMMMKINSSANDLDLYLNKIADLLDESHTWDGLE